MVSLVFGMPARLNREHLSAQVQNILQQSGEQSALQKKEVERRSPFGNNPPEVVVLTSNSLRKALLLYWKLIEGYNVDSWPEFASHIQYNPEELTTAFSVHTYFEKYIHNGDGTVREPLLIGFLPDGVPVILCPTDGESPANENPLLEASNKIADIREHFEGVDAVFLSSDSVQHIRTAGDEKLGKPMNSTLYTDMMQRGLNLGIDLDQIQQTFNETYLHKYYHVEDGQPLVDTHVTGLVAERGTQRIEREFILSIEVQEWMLQCVQVCLDMGGGGVFQQLVNLLAETDPEVWLKLDEGALQEYLLTLDKELWPFVIVFQIMGMPAMIHSVLEELAELPEE